MAVRRGEESWKRQRYKKAMPWEWQRGVMRMLSANSDLKRAYVGGRGATPAGEGCRESRVLGDRTLQLRQGVLLSIAAVVKHGASLFT